MGSETGTKSNGFFTGAYDLARTYNPSEMEEVFRVGCLCTAIKTGDIEIVDTLLQEGFDVNEVIELADEGIYTRPLTVAILDGKEEMAKHLIERGAEVGNAPYDPPTYGTCAITDAMQLEPMKAISQILGMEAVRSRLRAMDGNKQPDENPVRRFVLGRSPLAAACFIKSVDLVEALLDAGAEFGEYYYIALSAAIDDEIPCPEQQRKRLIDAVLNARDRVGFDRFIDATLDFEQYVNGEWRRGLSDDDYSPAVAAQEKAWRICDRLLTSPAYRKRLPMSQLLYSKYCNLTVDDVLGMIVEVAEIIDSATDIEALGTILMPLNARRFCARTLSPISVDMTTDPKTKSKVLIAAPKWKDVNDESGMVSEFKSVVIPLLQEKAADIKIDLDEYDKTISEIALTCSRTDMYSFVGLTLDSNHTSKDFKDLFGESLEKNLLMLAVLFEYSQLVNGEVECSIRYDEQAVKKAIDYWHQDNLSEIKNYLKCNYAYSFTDLIKAKASEQDPGSRFSAFAKFSGPLITDELSPVYLESVLDDKAINELGQMFANIKNAYQIAIKQSDYLSGESRTKALKKLGELELVVVGLSQPRDPIKKTLIIDDWNFVDNLNRIMSLYVSREFEGLIRGDDGLYTNTTSQAWDYNACYSIQNNNVELYGAYLLPPNYSSKRSTVMNYAAIGRVIGHEISHAFDPESIQLLKTLGGDDDAVDIFSSSPTYAENIERLKDQFKGEIPRRLVQANPTLAVFNEFDNDRCVGENFADVVGLEVSLFAYALSRGFTSIEELVEACIDDVKLFLQSYAMSFRSKPSLNWLMYQMKYDTHAPDEFRANTVKNLDAFHEAFGTKEGDGMWLDPEKRVSVFGIK